MKWTPIGKDRILPHYFSNTTSIHNTKPLKQLKSEFRKNKATEKNEPLAQSNRPSLSQTRKMAVPSTSELWIWNCAQIVLFYISPQQIQVYRRQKQLVYVCVETQRRQLNVEVVVIVNLYLMQHLQSCNTATSPQDITCQHTEQDDLTTSDGNKQQNPKQQNNILGSQTGGHTRLRKAEPDTGGCG